MPFIPAAELLGIQNNKIDIISHQDMIDFLAAYENLLRVEANLLMGDQLKCIE
jgi:hypothetical protein